MKAGHIVIGALKDYSGCNMEIILENLKPENRISFRQWLHHTDERWWWPKVRRKMVVLVC